MSASGGFTPPEFPLGAPQDPQRPRQPGLPLGAALGILAGVVGLGLVLVFTLGHPKPGGSSALVALPSTSSAARSPDAGGSTAPAGGASGAASGAAPNGSAGSGAPGARPTGTAAGGGPGGAGEGSAGGTGPTGDTDSSAFYVGECVKTSGSGDSLSVDQASCSAANYKIIHAFPNVSGVVAADQAQCYAINGDDDEFENGDPVDGYTLYCMNSLTGDYSPRRAAVDNCLDATGTYEVDCTGTRAYWIVIGRLDGTTDTKGCSRYGSYDQSYYWTAAPPFVLCVNRYHR